ncbi:MAG: hypothetical protein GMKNLPBB_02401 [Myxococcota bacterium]|nr:hypothetical protein [Myxococcota bacterium]
MNAIRSFIREMKNSGNPFAAPSVILILLGMAFAAGGCDVRVTDPDSSFQVCGNTYNCPTGEFCQDGRCIKTTVCPAGEQCDDSSFLSCADSSVCPLGEFCDSNRGRCVNSQAPANPPGDEPCKPGMELAANICAPACAAGHSRDRFGFCVPDSNLPSPDCGKPCSPGRLCQHVKDVPTCVERCASSNIRRDPATGVCLQPKPCGAAVCKSTELCVLTVNGDKCMPPCPPGMEHNKQGECARTCGDAACKAGETCEPDMRTGKMACFSCPAGQYFNAMKGACEPPFICGEQFCAGAGACVVRQGQYECIPQCPPGFEFRGGQCAPRARCEILACADNGQCLTTYNGVNDTIACTRESRCVVVEGGRMCFTPCKAGEFPGARGECGPPCPTGFQFSGDQCAQECGGEKCSAAQTCLMLPGDKSAKCVQRCPDGQLHNPDTGECGAAVPCGAAFCPPGRVCKDPAGPDCAKQ